MQFHNADVKEYCTFCDGAMNTLVEQNEYINIDPFQLSMLFVLLN